jgi:hypothetical protein
MLQPNDIRFHCRGPLDRKLLDRSVVLLSMENGTHQKQLFVGGAQRRLQLLSEIGTLSLTFVLFITFLRD